MAITQTTTKNITSSNGSAYILKTYFVENSTNVANNTSSITVTATLSSNGGSFSSNYNQTLSISWWDSKTNTWTVKASKNVTSLGLGASVSVTATFNAEHLSDGKLRGQSKANWTYNNGGAWCPSTSEIKNPSGSDLTVIPRTSTPTLSASSVEIGNNVTINTNRASTSFTHDITAKFGSSSTVNTIATGVTDSTTFNSATWASGLKSAAGTATSVSVVFTVTTKSGSTTIGSKTVSLTVNITPSAPTVSASSVEIGNAVTVNTNRLSTTSARTHNIYYKIGSGNWTKFGNNIETSVAFNTWSYVSALVSAQSSGKTTVSLSCDTFVNGVQIGTKTTSVTVTINPSVPTLDKSTITVGGTVTLTTNRKSTTSARTHTVTWKIGSTTLETDSGVTTSCDINTNSYKSSIMTAIGTTASSGTVTATVSTIINGSSIGSKSVSFTANVDVSAYKPTITFGTLTDTNTAVKNYHASDAMINALSNMSLPITFGVTATQGMALKSYKITFGTLSQSGNLSGTSGSVTYTATGVQSNTVTVAVTDARGTTVTATKTFTLVGYAKPTISNAEVSRISMTGTDAKFTLKGTGYAGTYSGSSSVTNSITITYTVRQVGGSAVSGAQTYTRALSGSGSRNWSCNDLTFSESFTNDKQYDIVFTVRDAFSSISTSALRIYNGLPVYGWGETHFDVYGDLHLHKRSDASERWVLPDAFDAILQYEARKNLLPSPQTGSTTTNGITFTVNSNGSVTASGTATANAYFYFAHRNSSPLKLAQGNYRLSNPTIVGDGYSGIAINYTDSSGSEAWVCSTTIETDVPFTVTNYMATNGIGVYIRIKSGESVNTTFYPMIRDARIADDEYVPYIPPSKSYDMSAVNIDNLVTPGSYTVTNPTGTLPITTSYAQIYVLDSAYSWRMQIGIFNKNAYYRYKSNATTAWEGWEPLTQAKGTLTSGNLNDVMPNTIYYMGTSYTYTNSPVTNGILETVASNSGSSYRVQRITTPTQMFFRFKSGSGWSSWYKVTATAV